MSLAQAKVATVESERLLGSAKHPAKAPKRALDPAIVVSVVALLVLAASMGHVAQRARVATLTYDLHVERLRLAEVKRIHNHLLVEVERARALDRIEAEARGRLGMAKPAQTTWLVLDAPASAAAEEIAEAGEGRLGVAAALLGWFERVRSEIRAALPR